MIKTLIDMLTLDEFYGISKNVDIAKGLHKKPATLKEAKELIIRIYNG
tara:strand:+ start:106 stop:249 length:144 start_codon:yes stop_codon:yes gene_type:complete